MVGGLLPTCKCLDFSPLTPAHPPPPQSPSWPQALHNAKAALGTLAQQHADLELRRRANLAFSGQTLVGDNLDVLQDAVESIIGAFLLPARVRRGVCGGGWRGRRGAGEVGGVQDAVVCGCVLCDAFHPPPPSTHPPPHPPPHTRTPPSC